MSNDPPRPDGTASSGHLVVVGSSAGGIEALSILAASFPRDFPAPIVLAQHLDPNRPSHLASILERRASLPIVPVVGPTPLAGSKIYVVPSNRHVVIHDGVVHPEEDHGDRPRPSVDLLLSTAAASYGERLIAVILTGSGSDGAAGAVDVKAAGGVVIIQNPQTARYPSMPLALPPTAVDHVADLENIGTLLVDLLKGSSLGHAEPAGDVLPTILGLVSRRANVDFRPYKPSTILRRIGRRMAVTRRMTLSDYAEYLRRHPQEIDELVKALLIKVTEFFRDGEAFEYLKAHVFPELIERARGRGRVLRLWSAGCATGEEAYSLALMATEHLGSELPEWSVKVFATDLDDHAIAFARRGHYPANVLRSLPREYLDRYFEPMENGYRLTKAVRGMVIFGQQDLSRGAPFPRIDLVTCRNLLIYFTTELQQEVLDLFAYALRHTSGFLFLGKAETARPSRSNYEMVNKRWKIYRCLSGPGTAPRHGSSELSSVRESRRDRQAKAAPKPSVEAGGLEVEELRRFGEAVFRNVPLGLVVIDRGYHVVHMNGLARRMLGIRDARPQQDLLHTLRGLHYAQLRQAIDRVFREHVPVSLPEMPVEAEGVSPTTSVTLTVIPLATEAGAPPLALLTVADVSDAARTKGELNLLQVEHKRVTDELGSTNHRLQDVNKRMQDSNQQLQATNEELQATNEELMLAQEELQATNEEFEATNEELQATNEELETNNEELQATNEELETTNEELVARTGELQELTRILGHERVRLGEMVERSPFYILVLRGPGLVLEAYHPPNGRLFGGRHAVGSRFEDLCSRAGVPELAAASKTVFETQRAWSSRRVPVMVPDEDGRPEQHLFVFHAVRTDDAADANAVVLYAENVTEESQREQEERRRNLKLMVEHAAQVALALFDADGKLLQASPRYLEILSRTRGIEEGAITARSWPELGVMDANDESVRLFRDVVESGTAHHVPEVRVGSGEGETLWDCSLIPIPLDEPGARNRIGYVVVSAVEVTDKVRAREELRKLDALKDQFLSLASHELRTPLVPLATYSDLMSQMVARGELPPQIGPIVAKFRKQIDQLTRMADDLLDVARLESGKLSIERRPVELSTVVADAVERAKMLNVTHDFRVENGAGALPLLGDEDRLVQVVFNLLENAVKYAGDGPVEIRLKKEDSGRPARAVLEIEDHGPGMPPEELASIFERFHQASGPSSHRRGLGLGLFIARDVVSQHGGSIQAQSSIGRGSVFTIRLPLADRSEPAAAGSGE